MTQLQLLTSKYMYTSSWVGTWMGMAMVTAVPSFRAFAVAMIASWGSYR